MTQKSLCINLIRSIFYILLETKNMKTLNQRTFFCFAVLCFILTESFGQSATSLMFIKKELKVIAIEGKTPLENKIYETHLLEHGGTILAGGILTYLGIQHQQQEEDILVSKAFSLNSKNVNSFDRGAIDQNTANLETSRIRSDNYLGLSLGLVPLLALDKRVRKEWSSIFVLYFESLAITAATQAWTAIGTNRYRPITYMTDVDTARRVDRANVNSFYSGHTSATATASFFAAKVYSDLHPEIGNKKWLLYAAAVIPPYLVGSNRVRAGKHFYSDALIGGFMGAASGILVPQLHKRKKKRNTSFMPRISPNSIGLNYSLTF